MDVADFAAGQVDAVPRLLDRLGTGLERVVKNKPEGNDGASREALRQGAAQPRGRQAPIMAGRCREFGRLDAFGWIHSRTGWVCNPWLLTAGRPSASPVPAGQVGRSSAARAYFLTGCRPRSVGPGKVAPPLRVECAETAKKIATRQI